MASVPQQSPSITYTHTYFPFVLTQLLHDSDASKELKLLNTVAFWE